MTENAAPPDVPTDPDDTVPVPGDMPTASSAASDETLAAAAQAAQDRRTDGV